MSTQSSPRPGGGLASRTRAPRGWIDLDPTLRRETNLSVGEMVSLAERGLFPKPEYLERDGFSGLAVRFDSFTKWRRKAVVAAVRADVLPPVAVQEGGAA